MTLAEIKIKIGERCDDDSGTAYTNRYEGIFISAMIDVVKATDKDGNALYSPSEYPELVQSIEKDITASDGFSKVPYSDLNAIFVKNIYTDPLTIEINKRINFQKRTIDELQFIRSNPHLRPEIGEGYWAEKSESIFLLTAKDNESTNNIAFDAIVNPKVSVWGTSDLETVYYYGRSFIEACIKQSATILKSEIGLE